LARNRAHAAAPACPRAVAEGDRWSGDRADDEDTEAAEDEAEDERDDRGDRGKSEAQPGRDRVASAKLPVPDAQGRPVDDQCDEDLSHRGPGP
jgi:hypothetical protein